MRVEFWVSRTVADGVTEIATNWGDRLGFVVDGAEGFKSIPTPGGTSGTFERFADAVSALTNRSTTR